MPVMKTGQQKDDSASAAQSLHEQARGFIKQERFDDALAALRQSIAAHATAPAHHDAGVIHYMRGQIDEAVKSFQAATLCDSGYHQAYANLARILFAGGQGAKAAEYALLAMRVAPDDIAYKEDFTKIVRGMGFLAFYPEMKQAILSCLKEDRISHQELASPWFALLKRDPAFKEFLPLLKCADYAAFERAFDGVNDLAVLDDPYMLLGLRRLWVADPGFERFLTHMRRALAADSGTLAREYLPFTAALAEYCFYTGYIFDVSAEEEAARAAFRADAEKNPHAFALAGCYDPLCDVPGFTVLAKKHETIPELTTLARAQITEPLEERTLRAVVKPFNLIEDSVSRAVQEQYEEFPYPRWKALGMPPLQDVLEGSLPDAPAILIAGCGTGREALEYAAMLPHAEILAVDLSLSSLSYAMRKAHEYGLSNVEFRHGDIAGLGALDKKFDIISSCGVLHHMNDPEAGWRVLTGILKDSGLMNIALYSECGRQDVVAARAIIAKRGYGNDCAGIRAFRRDAARLMKKKHLARLLNRRDYYSMPECRDLLFHVQEHRFTLPRIDRDVRDLGLRLIKMLPPDREVLPRYLKTFPCDPQALNLKNWDKFERKNQETFESMYNLWCRKA
ncbi:MAG: methyltransferase domain-containing protein [Proteobacteria bacterium]|nr:methyltransferase domain-containing protein [Pseudomonadota bacterium]